MTHETTEYRLNKWAERARSGITQAEFAADLGIKVTCLRKMLNRARKRGDPRAISNNEYIDRQEIGRNATRRVS